jgi:polysaccharide biosynthesis/export protein
VLIRKAGVVYVLGAVNRPGGYVMQEAGDLNVMQAIALADGTTRDASLGGVRILRKRPDGSLLQIPTHYDKTRKGDGVILALQAEDVLYVPENGFKAALMDGGHILSAATSAAIYTFH